MNEPRLLALISHPGDLEAIQQWTRGHFDVTTQGEGDAREFDVCVVDIEAFKRQESLIHRLRSRHLPIQVPVVLLVPSGQGESDALTGHPDVDACLSSPLKGSVFLSTLDQVLKMHRKTKQVDVRRQLLEGLLDQTLVGIYLVVNDRIIHANASACQIFGRSGAELAKMSALEPFDPSDQPKIAASRNRDSRRDHPPEQVGVWRPDGTHVMVEIQELAIEHEGKQARCGTMVNVQRRMDAERSRLEAASREASTRVALDASLEQNRLHKRLFDALSHELRTPLTELRGFTEMGVEGPECDRGVHLAAIAASVDRLEHLVENLLQYTRFESDLEAYQPETLDPGELLRVTVARIARHHPQGHLTIDSDPRTPSCIASADGRLLELLLTNLLEDAMRRSRPGESVHVTMAAGNGTWRCTISAALREVPRPPRGPEAQAPVIDELGMLGIAQCINERILQLHGASLDTSSKAGRVHETLTLPVPDQRQPERGN